jgi:hypothetical protein
MRHLKIHMHRMECGIETTVNQGNRYEYTAYHHWWLKNSIHRRKGLKKNSRPTQADKNEPWVGLHVSKRIVVFTSQCVQAPFVIVF